MATTNLTVSTTVTPDLGPRLTFLSNAAHLLATQSPQTSAFIMSERNRLLELNDLNLPKKEAHHSCHACGHIFLPTCGSTIEFVNHRPVRADRQKQRKHRKQQQPKIEKTSRPIETVIQYTCGLCGKYTRHSCPRPPRPSPSSLKQNNRAQPRGKAKDIVSLTPTPKVTTQELKPPASSIRRKRAKGKKGGLEALVNKTQSSRSVLHTLFM